MQTCTRCKESKPTSEFYGDPRMSTGRMSRCKACHQQYYWARRDVIRAQRRAWWTSPEGRRKKAKYARREKYGMSEDDFRGLLAAQENRCAICRGVLTETHHDTNVDHDHQSGVVRGLLCHGCNLMLGHAKDSEDRLLAAVAYLRRRRLSVVA